MSACVVLTITTQATREIFYTLQLFISVCFIALPTVNGLNHFFLIYLTRIIIYNWSISHSVTCVRFYLKNKTKTWLSRLAQHKSIRTRDNFTLIWRVDVRRSTIDYSVMFSIYHKKASFSHPISLITHDVCSNRKYKMDFKTSVITPLTMILDELQLEPHATLHWMILSVFTYWNWKHLEIMRVISGRPRV